MPHCNEQQAVPVSITVDTTGPGSARVRAIYWVTPMAAVLLMRSGVNPGTCGQTDRAQAEGRSARAGSPRVAGDNALIHEWTNLQCGP